MEGHISRGPIDSATLDLLRERVQTYSLVEQTDGIDTNNMLTTLVFDLDTDRYPSVVTSASLEIQWYENDEYNFHYCERHDDETVWQCRWDRHPNPHASYAHFHRPPDADRRDVIDDPVGSTHLADMLTRTLANIDERIASLRE